MEGKEIVLKKRKFAFIYEKIVYGHWFLPEDEYSILKIKKKNNTTKYIIKNKTNVMINELLSQ